MSVRFRNRVDAGSRLGERLASEGGASDRDLVLGIPRGGAIVGAQTASVMRAEFDVFVAQRIAAPGHARLNIGAMTYGGESSLEQRLVDELALSSEQIKRAQARELEHVERLTLAFRGTVHPPNVHERRIIVVDEGMSTGRTAEVVGRALTVQKPSELLLAVPVASRVALHRVEPVFDGVICLEVQEPFVGVADSYDSFEQVEDDEVHATLHHFPQRLPDMCVEAPAHLASQKRC